MNILDGLNEEQQKAVLQIDNPVLILAGAGSGKTKTITSRLAYLIGEVGVDPSSTLTLTFTNKAATQMRERALSLLSKNGQLSFPPLLCTFHKFGLLFLKFHMHLLGRKNSFVVIDTDDKKRILKTFLTQSETAVSSVANEISRFKNSLLSPKEAYASAEQKYYKDIAKVYEQYENYTAQNNLVDFDDLLVLTYKILDDFPEVCEQTSQRYRYIMIDEYQDTNDLQYRLIRKLCSHHQNICVVGDDDQSIYGWRGANIKNILDFAKNFENTQVIKLENNYRSTSQILKAANDLIDYNRNRMGKVLRSVNGEGKEIALIDSHDENAEASQIAKKIKKLILSGVSPKEIAVLYRINALSRSLEEGLNKEGVVYKMVGGVKFYERSEIKDLISYLRLIANVHDDFSFKRVVNRPKRGLGKVSIDKIVGLANDKRVSLYEYVKEHIDESGLSKKAVGSLVEFVQSLERTKEVAQNATYDIVDTLEDEFHIKNYYLALPDGFDRGANIDEFYGLLRDQIKQNPSLQVEEFLNELALLSDQDQIDGEAITIMSVHASKGLEFEHVFVIGLEEGFFPLIGDGSDIEEERRLGYVAITRAKKELSLSFSSSRFYKGRRTELLKSRFLKECGVCEGSLTMQKSTAFKKGDLVKHKIFGMGRISEVSKAGREFKLKINFGGVSREIMASFVEKI